MEWREIEKFSGKIKSKWFKEKKKERKKERKKVLRKEKKKKGIK